MGMQLKIESDEACRLASELAELKGESLEQAVTAALRERLERERKIQEKVEQMLALGREIRAHMKEPVSSADPDDFYDEDGLPR